MELIGHENTKKQLEVAIISAVERNTSLPHMLFAGAPGCGKTSMAHFVAKKLGYPFLSAIPNDMVDYKGVFSILENLNHDNYDDMGNRTGKITPTILFFDEIHNMPLKGQEILGIAMERFMVESGTPNKFLWTPRFTLVGATTKPGTLSKPFRDRFKLNFTFEPYNVDDMCKIVKVHAKRENIIILPSAVMAVAKRSRGTPRIAVRFVERVRDHMISSGSQIATIPLVESMFSDMGIDGEGFTTTELKILRCLFDSRVPVGLDNLAIITEEDKKTIRDHIEPFLIRKGLILVMSKGRILTERGIEYIENFGTCKKTKKEITFDYERT